MSIAASQPAIERLPWTVAKARIARLDNSLASELDAIVRSAPAGKRGATDVDSKHSIFILRYLFGSTIVADGQFQLPITTSAPEVKVLNAATQYAAIPLCIVTSGSVEVFRRDSHAVKIGLTRHTDRSEEFSYTYPQVILTPGQQFGVFEVVDSLVQGHPGHSPWSVSAGARTLRLLVPVMDSRIAARLNDHFNSDIFDASNNDEWNADNWQLIHQVFKASQLPWFTELAVIPGSWLAGSSEVYLRLQNTLLKTAWVQSGHLRARGILEEKLTFIQKRSLPLGSEYYSSHLQHFAAIASGLTVAFAPPDTTDSLGPFTEIEKILVQAKVSMYYPRILAPTHLSERGHVGYYSFRLPTLAPHKPPKTKSLAHNVLDPFNSIFSRANCEERKMFGPLDFAKVQLIGHAKARGYVSPAAQLEPNAFIPLPHLKTNKFCKASQFFTAAIRLVRQ